MSNAPAGISLEWCVNGLDQVAFDESCHVVGGVETNHDLERVAGWAVEQHARGRGGEHARVGLTRRCTRSIAGSRSVSSGIWNRISPACGGAG